MADPRRGVLICYVLLAATAGLCPVSNDEVWWHQSRGRAVCSGEFAPSRSLLAADVQREADWLGGVPCFAFQFLFGNAGLMLWRLLACATMAVIAWRMFSAASPAAQILLASATLLVTESAWDPSPTLFGLLGIWLIQRLAATPSARFSLPAITACWANLAPAAVLSLAIVLVSTPLKRWSKIGLLGLMALAMCFTPRGLWTWRDSLIELCPPLAIDRAALAHTPFRPLWHDLDSGAGYCWAFLLLAATALLTRVPSRRLAYAPGLILGTLVAWASSANLPLAGFWLASIVASLTSQVQFKGARPIGSIAIGAVCALLLAGGYWPPSPQRLGWGLAPKLDLTMLGGIWNNPQVSGRVFCVDTRCAGAVSWLGGGRSRALDEPRRALLGGRLREHVLLCDDLAHQREGVYYRSDLSQGGWHVALAAQNVIGLSVPIERTEILAGLADSTWRPLTLASLDIPFGRAGDPVLSPQIVEVLKQENLISRGPWSAAPLPRFGSHSHVDLWGLITGRPDPSTSLFQSGMFASRKLPSAGLKLLFPVLREAPSTQASSLFERLQHDLASQEQLKVGQASQLRAAAIDSTSRLRRSAITAYARGSPAQAAAALLTNDAESRYARGWLMVEAGQPVEASQEFTALVRDYPDHPLSVVASHELAKLVPPQ